jgi:hypothetical protein
VVRSGQPRTGRSLLEEGGAGTRRSRSVRCDRSRPRTVAWKLRQRPQIRWRWRRERLLQPVGHPKMSRAETAPGWTTWKRCLSKPAGPEAGRFYSRGHTQARGSMCVFDAPEGVSHRIAPMASGSSRDARAEQARLSRPQQVGGASLRRGQVCHCRRSDTPARGRVAREGPAASA